jgi:PAS domain S-box-containing protein
MRGRPKQQLKLDRRDRIALGELANRRADSPSLALRAQIVLACAEGLDNVVVAHRIGATAHTVSKWRRRFVAHGVEGLTDRPRSGAPRSIDDAQVAAIAARRPEEAKRAASTRHVARECGVSASSVGRIWKNAAKGAAPVSVQGRAAMSAAAPHEGEAARGVDILSRGASMPSNVVSIHPQSVASDDSLGNLAQAFHMAPIGLLVSRRRVIVNCNQAFGEIFGCSRDELVGRSLECLYPSYDEFRHIGERAWPVMKETGFYSDERIMRKVDGTPFWCHVSGRAMDRADPFAAAIWSFEDLSSVRRVTRDLTRREREVAQLLVMGRSSKQIARELKISHRTVEAHRARLMRKFTATTTAELIGKLLGREQ